MIAKVLRFGRGGAPQFERSRNLDSFQKPEEEHILTKGDLFFLAPQTEHYLKMLEDTVVVYASSPEGK